MPNKGFLLVTMQPPPAFEEEFNAWYDSEHIPERLAVPGILTARRYVARTGHPPYLAMYDLETPSVMTSPAYLKVAFENSSPWTKRVTGRVKPWRSTGEQIWPGDRTSLGGAGVLLVRFRAMARGSEAAIVEGAKRAFASRPETLQARVLVHDAGAGARDCMVFVEQRQPASDGISLEAFGAAADRIDLWQGYLPL